MTNEEAIALRSFENLYAYTRLMTETAIQELENSTEENLKPIMAQRAQELRQELETLADYMEAQ